MLAPLAAIAAETREHSLGGSDIFDAEVRTTISAGTRNRQVLTTLHSSPSRQDLNGDFW
jgi:hypothetical protein